MSRLLPKTTRESFKEMIMYPYVHQHIGITANHVSVLRHRIRKHPHEPAKWQIRQEKMEELLQKAGYTLHQETMWVQ